MIKYLVQKQFFILVAIVVSFLGVFTIEAIAQQIPSYSNRFYYFYEVGNQIPLSDFALGSSEKIKDKDGNGLGFSWVIREGNKLKLELDLGYSRTVYKGQVEDGVEVTFEPQAGTDYEVLSSSKNVVYDFDLIFQNPYIGFNAVIDYFRIGGGKIIQSVEGDVTLYAENIEIAKAKYETKNQLYGLIGLDFNLEGLYFGSLLRAFEAPSLKITSCNKEALGTLVCSRINGATGNRNLRSNSFGEGVLQIGLMF